MYRRLLKFLRCPDCGGELNLFTLTLGSVAGSEEISEGLLNCQRGHWYPIVRGIPRMLPDALVEHWAVLEKHIPRPAPEPLLELVEKQDRLTTSFDFDTRTRSNFSHQWNYHDLGGRTWGMELSDRVKWYFLDPIGIPANEMPGKVMLDAGCGNGSQSVAYTEFGLEVIAVDLSSGLERGYAYRTMHPNADPEKIHFVQGDLQRPPLAPAMFDIIHTAGVLHVTPNTHKTWLSLRPLLRPGGTFYTWINKYEPVVTPVVDTIRILTTKIPSSAFARVAQVMAVPFLGFCWMTNALGVRSYSRLNRREAALALMDIFGSPYAHSHSFPEAKEWYSAAGFDNIWPCNDSRRGFGICGTSASLEAQEDSVFVQRGATS